MNSDIDTDSCGDILPQSLIDRAREYPIESMFDNVRMNQVDCPFHTNGRQRTASGYIENNFFYCFSCGVHKDAIDLYRHFNNCSFVEAVKKLNNV